MLMQPGVLWQKQESTKEGDKISLTGVREKASCRRKYGLISLFFIVKVT